MEEKSKTKEQQQQAEVHEQMDQLIEDGHVCIQELHTYPSQLEWCKQTPCAEGDSTTAFLLKDLPRQIKIQKKGAARSQEKIIEIYRMRHDNWKHLLPHAYSWDHAISSFQCDICQSITNPWNPIYTNPNHSGIDVCSSCLFKRMQKGPLSRIICLSEFHQEDDDR